jgi:excinuclease UvrABC nuclease subunit
VADIKGNILYKIWYDSKIVYVGRTKQPLQNRLRGHFFKKPMHRDIDIFSTTKVEYTVFQGEADMYLYEVYFINLYKPNYNYDDKSWDELTVTLPEVEWSEYTIKLMDKWKKQITEADYMRKVKQERSLRVYEEKHELRKQRRIGELSEEDYWVAIDKIDGLIM